MAVIRGPLWGIQPDFGGPALWLRRRVEIYVYENKEFRISLIFCSSFIACSEILVREHIVK